MNRERLVICLEESLHIQNIKDMKVVHTIANTPPNPQGIFALSLSNSHCYLAYPGSNPGQVEVFDTINLQATRSIKAHQHPLAALAFSPSGRELATASDRGTVFRIYSVITGKMLCELRRGMKRCVQIASLAFSTCSEYLVCSSNTETIHIFKLGNNLTRQEEEERQPDDWMG